jgi:DNA-directed RNA polymerase subunit RPC12/RpoP
MIRFKCIYCGQRIRAPDEQGGKKGKCPTCKHEVHVPYPPKKRPIVTLDASEREKMAKAELALMNIATDSPEDAAELMKEKAGWLIPVYDELSLFLMATTLILLYFVNTTMRVQIYNWISEYGSEWVYIIGIIFLCGLYLSVYHVFTTREKSEPEKWGMLIFAVLTNAVTGIVAGLYVLKNDNVRNWQLVFPIWNILNGILLLLMLRFKIIDEECISDRDASATEVVIGLAAVLIIFALCNYVFKLYWAITFSICIIYATSFDKALQSVFPNLAPQSDEPTS